MNDGLKHIKNEIAASMAYQKNNPMAVQRYTLNETIVNAIEEASTFPIVGMLMKLHGASTFVNGQVFLSTGDIKIPVEPLTNFIHSHLVPLFIETGIKEYFKFGMIVIRHGSVVTLKQFFQSTVDLDESDYFSFIATKNIYQIRSNSSKQKKVESISTSFPVVSEDDINSEYANVKEDLKEMLDGELPSLKLPKSKEEDADTEKIKQTIQNEPLEIVTEGSCEIVPIRDLRIECFIDHSSGIRQFVVFNRVTGAVLTDTHVICSKSVIFRDNQIMPNSIMSEALHDITAINMLTKEALWAEVIFNKNEMYSTVPVHAKPEKFDDALEQVEESAGNAFPGASRTEAQKNTLQMRKNITVTNVNLEETKKKEQVNVANFSRRNPQYKKIITPPTEVDEVCAIRKRNTRLGIDGEVITRYPTEPATLNKTLFDYHMQHISISFCVPYALLVGESTRGSGFYQSYRSMTKPFRETMNKEFEIFTKQILIKLFSTFISKWFLKLQEKLPELNVNFVSSLTVSYNIQSESDLRSVYEALERHLISPECARQAFLETSQTIDPTLESVNLQSYIDTQQLKQTRLDQMPNFFRHESDDETEGNGAEKNSPPGSSERQKRGAKWDEQKYNEKRRKKIGERRELLNKETPFSRDDKRDDNRSDRAQKHT